MAHFFDFVDALNLTDKYWYAYFVVNDKLQYNLRRFVEGMAPVFSLSAWYCTWHLIQVILIPWFIGILNLSSSERHVANSFQTYPKLKFLLTLPVFYVTKMLANRFF